jgi:hypothetical protein
MTTILASQHPMQMAKIVLTGKTTTRLYVFGLPADKHLDYVSPYCKADLGQDYVTCGPLEAFLALGGQGFTQATWSDGNTDLNRIIDSAGTYAVAAVNQYGCTARDTITLGQSDFPSVNLGENQFLCPGASLPWMRVFSKPMHLEQWRNDPNHHH